MFSPSKATFGALALALAGVLGACGDDGSTTSTSTSTTPPAATASAGNTTVSTVGGPATSTDASTTTAAAGTSIDVVYKGGKVQGATKFSVKKGDQISIKVTADISDEVHVHGYDKTAAVTPTSPAELSFKADKQGKFEVEFEKKHSLIFELEVK